MKTALLYRTEPRPVTVAVGPGDRGQSTAGEFGRNRTVVRFDDLNLSYDIDVRVLYRRIRVAASAYAPGEDGVVVAAAVDNIVAATVAAIQHPKLSDYHQRLTS